MSAEDLLAPALGESTILADLRATNEMLRRQNRVLANEIEQDGKLLSAKAEQLTKWMERAETAEALVEFTRHKVTCARVKLGDGLECTCGHTEALLAYRRGRGQIGKEPWGAAS